MYYDQQGNLKCFIINCYAQGFPNLKWNKDGIFSTFPPMQQAPLDSIVPRDELFNYLKPLSKTRTTNPLDFDYTVIVFWNRVTGRQSKRLIQYVQSNSMLPANKRVKIIYANNDPS